MVYKMDNINIEFQMLESLANILQQLKESESMKQSKENCQLLLGHASSLKRNIIKVVSEIDKCCQQMSNLTLKKQFHDAKADILTKTCEFSQLFCEISDVSEDITIDGDLLLSFVTDFEDLVQNIRDVLLAHEQLIIETASSQIKAILTILERLNETRLPDHLEAVFSDFCLQITSLWPTLNQLGKIIIDDPRNVTIVATYQELKYMCDPLSQSLTKAIFDPSNKPMKDQKLVISQRVSAILAKLRANLQTTTDSRQQLVVGCYTQYVEIVEELLGEFRNKSIGEPPSNYFDSLQAYLTEIIKYAAIISYGPKPYEDCDAMAQAQIILHKIRTLPQSLENLDSDEPNERVHFFGFCSSYVILLKRIECCYVNQVLEYYSDPIAPIKELISAIDVERTDDASIVKEAALKCSDYCSHMFIMGAFAIAKSTTERAKKLLQLMNTLEWLDGLMVPCAVAACESDGNFLKLKIYARIWCDCAIQFCSALDEMIDSKSLLHVAGIKFKDIYDSLSPEGDERHPEVQRSKVVVEEASKFANHLLLIQKVQPFYNGSRNFAFTNALRNLRNAPKLWDGSVIKLLEAINYIEQIHSNIMIMDKFDEDSTTDSSNTSTNLFTTTLTTDDANIVMNESVNFNNTSIDLTCYLNPSVLSKSVVGSSKKNFSLNTKDIKVSMKSVTQRNMAIANYLREKDLLHD